jgi:DNA-binding transcriptional regulator YiaG
MPNIGSVLKQEVVRLARKEVRSETEGLKKSLAQCRTTIAALKRQVALQEKQLARIEKSSPKETVTQPDGEAATRVRFSAKRLARQREKLGLSAGDMGVLLGVSAQTVYNWEAEKSRPRQAQLAAIAALRGIGKRQVKARLAEQEPAG